MGTYKVQDPTKLVGDAFFALCKGVDTPVSLGAWLRYKHGEHQDLANYQIKPSDYCDATAFHNDYIVTSYLRKYQGLETGVDLEAVALQSFVRAEEVCLEFNRDNQGRATSPRGASLEVGGIFATAQKLIARTLGRYDTRKWLPHCKMGPGATASLKGGQATLVDKMLQRPLEVTRTAMPYLKAHMLSNPTWLRARGIEAEGPCCILDSEFNVVKGGRLLVVPKNAKTGRTIHAEPTGNVFLQLGMGRYIRSVLRKVGIDLNTQLVNQSWAELSYELGLATVDLSMASDTIAKKLISMLLPEDWAQALSDLRSAWYSSKGEWYLFHKWSSMGNGYTFELESLIFWALSKAVALHTGSGFSPSIYGDDIIVSSGDYKLLVEVLNAAGFQVNLEKSFASGPFYESCGKHFFHGFDVTPVYLEEVPRDEPATYVMANALHRLAIRRGNDVTRDAAFRGAILAIERVVPDPAYMPYGNEGDHGLLRPVGELDPSDILSRNLTSLWAPRVKMWGLSFIPSKRRLFREEEVLAMVAYWHDHKWEEPFNGQIPLRGRGCYRRRRRWYSTEAREELPWVVGGQKNYPHRTR